MVDGLFHHGATLAHAVTSRGCNPRVLPYATVYFVALIDQYEALIDP